MNYEVSDPDQAYVRHWALVAAQNDFSKQGVPPTDAVLARAENYLAFLSTGKAPEQTGGSVGVSGSTDP